jgi:hypothetical protein
MRLRVLILCVSCVPILVAGQGGPGQKPQPVSPASPALPPQPEPEPIPEIAPPPPPPAQPQRYQPLVFDIRVDGRLPWALREFWLPPSQKPLIQWSAVGPGGAPITSGIDLELVASAPMVRLLPKGGLELATGDTAPNVRLIARRTNYRGPFRVDVTITFP